MGQAVKGRAAEMGQAAKEKAAATGQAAKERAGDAKDRAQGTMDLVHGNCINLTKGALICADRVLTVSPNYARDIQTKGGASA